MKFSVRILAIVIFFAFGFFSPAATETNSFATDGDSFTATQISEAFGWLVAQEKEVNGIDISAPELTVFLRGFFAGSRDQPLPFAAPGIFPDVRALAIVRQERVFRAIERQSAAATETFLQEWRKNPQVSELPGGIYCQILQPGGNMYPKPGQTVKVHYMARLVNGTDLSEFGPDNLLLVTNHLNRGLFEGFQKIGVGGKMRLLLPPALAQQEIEMTGAPKGSSIIYEIEMLGVSNTPPDEMADALVAAAPDAPSPGYSGNFTTNEVIETWGWQLAQQTRISKLTLNADELAMLMKGFEIGVRGQPFPGDIRRIQPEVERFVIERKRQFALAFRQRQIADMNDLFARLKENTNVVTLPDGLCYEVLRPGHGSFPRPGQIVLVNYTARLIDGRIFDRTMNEPLHVKVGSVIRGWNEGIQKINKSGKIRLYIPPSLGYGSDAVSGIPADSTLIYEIELVNIERDAGQ